MIRWAVIDFVGVLVLGFSALLFFIWVMVDSKRRTDKWFRENRNE